MQSLVRNNYHPGYCEAAGNSSQPTWSVDLDAGSPRGRLDPDCWRVGPDNSSRASCGPSDPRTRRGPTAQSGDRLVRWFLGSLQPIIARRQAVPIWGQPDAAMRLDSRQGDAVLSPGHLHENLKQRAEMWWETEKRNPKESNLSGWRSRERLLHLHSDSQFDIIQINSLLFGMVRVRLRIIQHGRDIPCMGGTAKTNPINWVQKGGKKRRRNN